MTSVDALRSEIRRGLKRFNEDKKLLQKATRLSKTQLPICKSHELSDTAREKGNEILGKGRLDKLYLHKILCLYNESIAHSPAGSDGMAKAFANKSAILLHMRKYKESIIEADKALAITGLVSVRVKLLCRKAECLTALGSSDNRSCLERARFTLNKLEDAATKESLMKWIEKGQLAIDEQKLDIPKENKKLVEISKTIAFEESKDIWKSVEFKHSEKYGRHLIASRDFEPGEIILVKKTYSNHLKESKMYQYCGHCFNYLWTVVPCEQCCWRLFCSEECKSEACHHYHDMECSLISKIKWVFPHQWVDTIQFTLNILFKALRGAGSIDQLQTDFESLQDGDQCVDSPDYKTLLTLPTCGFTKEEMEMHVQDSVIALVSLAKFTTIFKESFKFKEMEKLMRDDTAISVGCLLLKFRTVLASGCATVWLRDPSEPDEPIRIMVPGDPIEKDDCSHSPVINLMTMLTLVGCIPNVEACRTIGNRSLMFALQPIKAGTPIVVYNRSSSFHLATPKARRQSTHQKYYKSSCNCRACKENWDVGFMGKLIEIEIPQGLDPWASERFNNEFGCLTTQWTTHIVHGRKSNYPDLRALSRIKNLVAEAWKHFSLPSPMLVSATNLLVGIIVEFYDRDKNVTNSPEST